MNDLKLTFIATKEELLRDFLVANNISKKTLTHIKYDEGGKILVNNKEENVRYTLKKSDVVDIFLPYEKFSDNVRFIKNNINIIFEDEYILIVDKPAHIPTIPSRNADDNSLLEYVNYYFKNKNYTTIPHIVTRLDKNTSGLVLIAKHRHIHAMFSKVKLEKFYLAVVKGKTETHKIIEKNIAREDGSIITRKVDPNGAYAKTELSLVKYFAKQNYSLIKLKLFTGRTHQIRVHCKHIGFSLLGDELYGGDLTLIKRQALHCSNLIFNHPVTNEEISIESKLHNDMKKLIED